MYKKIDIRELCDSISGNPKILGASGIYKLSPAEMESANINSICYCAKTGEDAVRIINKSKARVIFCQNTVNIEEEDYKSRTIIMVTNPRLAFAQMLQKYYSRKIKFGISPNAVVEKGARIDSEVYIGPNCYIGKCRISRGTRIYGNVHIYSSDVEIGENVIINAGVVIGVEGMDYARDETGALTSASHIGGVKIGNNVEVGAGTVIVRGFLADTIIAEDTQIGHLCMIGHQDIIGKHCLIITKTAIAGRCQVGDYSFIGLGSSVRPGTKIGKNVMIGMGSVVTGDIEDNCIAFGVPAKVVRENKMTWPV